MSRPGSFLFEKTRIGLQGLIRLRWFAAAGQAMTCVVAQWILHIPLPLEILGACIGVTLLSNALLEYWQSCLPLQRTAEMSAGLLALDTLTLTAMLFWTGGVQNPFTTFYLLHITIAAILLPAVWFWMVVAFCAACGGSLAFSSHLLASYPPQGQWVALALTGVFIAFFVAQLNRELTEVRDLSMRNERFAALATLAAGIAHELATPLGTIAVASADFEHSASANPPNHEALADARLIRAEVERCRLLLEKLSDRATRGIGDPASTVRAGDIPELLERYLDPVYPPWIRWEIGDRSAGLLVPETSLLQALAVLVKNAFEASGPNQSVRVEIKSDTKNARFAVCDEGVGMSPEIAARVGDPFFTTKEPGSGMGLGLFLVRTFVERVHGHLEIQSAPGKGTAIHLTIPHQTFSLAR